MQDPIQEQSSQNRDPGSLSPNGRDPNESYQDETNTFLSSAQGPLPSSMDNGESFFDTDLLADPTSYHRDSTSTIFNASSEDPRLRSVGSGADMGSHYSGPIYDAALDEVFVTVFRMSIDAWMIESGLDEMVAPGLLDQDGSMDPLQGVAQLLDPDVKDRLRATLTDGIGGETMPVLKLCWNMIISQLEDAKRQRNPLDQRVRIRILERLLSRLQDINRSAYLVRNKKLLQAPHLFLFRRHDEDLRRVLAKNDPYGLEVSHRSEALIDERITYQPNVATNEAFSRLTGREYAMTKAYVDTTLSHGLPAPHLGVNASCAPRYRTFIVQRSIPLHWLLNEVKKSHDRLMYEFEALKQSYAFDENVGMEMLQYEMEYEELIGEDHETLTKDLKNLAAMATENPIEEDTQSQTAGVPSKMIPPLFGFRPAGPFLERGSVFIANEVHLSPCISQLVGILEVLPR